MILKLTDFQYSFQLKGTQKQYAQSCVRVKILFFTFHLTKSYALFKGEEIIIRNYTKCRTMNKDFYTVVIYNESVALEKTLQNEKRQFLCITNDQGISHAQ